MTPPAPTWKLMTPPGAGAVAIIQVHGDIEATFAACGIAPVAVGEVRLRELAGVDRGLVARFTEGMCQLMPHGGVAVVRSLLAELNKRGIGEDPAVTAGPPYYPEARSEVEARALAVLKRAASPLALDLLLAQHQLWSRPGAASDPRRDRVLNRLIDPPLVVAVGASNIGKSTLVNALAGRSVSIVADEPGTTRDHVGVMLDLAGLVVRYVDTPGLRAGAGELEQQAVEGAMALARRADLLLLCGDATAAPPALPWPLAERMVLALRSDLGEPAFRSDAAVSASRAEGIAELVGAVRERLVPESALRDPRAWRFW
jgi:tRNA U34 5-carboxymethylaminomethyl modifying GTPase MnmE/TrmE